LIARANPKGVLFGYFFGPRRESVPDFTDTAVLTPEDAVLVARFGHLGLTTGIWPVLGRDPRRIEDAWPMPSFYRYEELTGRTLNVTYSPDDPNRVLHEVQIDPKEAVGRPKDGLYGAGAVETALTSLLR
jgi:hypothetical protein